MMQELTVDLSTELAEGFAIDPCGIPPHVLKQVVVPETGLRFHRRQTMERADDALLPVISSAYLACGLHSGDPLVIRGLIPTLLEKGVRIGAHPSYPDVFNFGQHRVPMTSKELVSVFLYQFGALDGILREFDERIRYVKCHGALNFDVADEDWACDAIVQAVRIFDPEIIIVSMACTPTMERLKASGLRIAEEGFVDRGYGTDGRILRRNHPKALHTSAADAVNQVISIVKDGVVEADDGSLVPMHADTFCLHSDSPGADAMAKALVDALRAENIQIKPTADFL
ncbi:MAG: LamB/YcsF family protein [Deltaproteobacteria bacterium]|jgi:5-oxoprolinase (ATP-hydrolysing) subunit A|nr:LamB/YcsF family protein [Deltaproteobacteria bacterium]